MRFLFDFWAALWQIAVAKESEYEVSLYEQVAEEAGRTGGIITVSRAAELGVSRQLMLDYARRGKLERLRHGVYGLPDTVHDEMYTLQLCQSKAVFSHETALYLNGIGERTPFAYAVTLPRKASLSSALAGECECFYVKPAWYSVGIAERRTPFGNPVRCYNAERTLCDMLRCGKRTNVEALHAALKNYAASPQKDLHLLGQYGAMFGVEKELRMFVGLLL